MNCEACGAELETPLACGHCQALHRPDPGLSPYEVLGVERAWEVDEKALRKRLLKFTRLTHPDFHGAAGPEVRELAEENSARLNEAFELLADPVRRAAWLLKDLGGPSEQDERQMPQAFLMEVLEWNEALEEARDSAPGAPERQRLEGLLEELTEQREHTLARIAGGLTPLPARGAEVLTEVRRQLNAVRYLDRALGQIAELRLEQENVG